METVPTKLIFVQYLSMVLYVKNMEQMRKKVFSILFYVFTLTPVSALISIATQTGKSEGAIRHCPGAAEGT